MPLPSHCVALPSLYSRVASTTTAGAGCIVQYSYMVIAITSQWNQNLIKALWSVYIPPTYVECGRFKSKIEFQIWMPNLDSQIIQKYLLSYKVIDLDPLVVPDLPIIVKMLTTKD